MNESTGINCAVVSATNCYSHQYDGNAIIRKKVGHEFEMGVLEDFIPIDLGLEIN
jgi:hypothetical protein